MDPSLLDEDEMLAFVRARMAGTIRTPFIHGARSALWAARRYAAADLPLTQLAGLGPQARRRRSREPCRRRAREQTRAHRLGRLVLRT